MNESCELRDDGEVKPRAWLREPKVQRLPGRHLVRGVSVVEPTAEERECAELDGDMIIPLYDKMALDAAIAAEREQILSMPNLMHACDHLGVPSDGTHCDILRRALYRA